LHELNLLDFIVEEVEVNDVLDVVFTADSSNQVFGYTREDTTHRDLRRHRILDCCGTGVFTELIVVIHKLLDVTSGQEVMKRAFQTAHVTPVQILSRQVDILGLIRVFCEPDGRVSKHSLSLSNASK